MQHFANPHAELTAKELAQALGVYPQLVNRWHTHGYVTRDGDRVHLPSAGTNRKGERLFRYLDGALAEAATRKSPKSFRRVDRRPERGPSSWADLNRQTAA